MGLIQKYSALVVLAFCVSTASSIDDTTAATLDNEDEDGNHTFEASAQKLSNSVSRSANSTEDSDTTAIKKAITAAATEYKSVTLEKKHKANMESLKRARADADASRKKSEEIHAEVLSKQMKASKQVQEVLRQQKLEQVKAAVANSKKSTKGKSDSAVSREIKSVEKELEDKEKELKVQAKLAKEKGAAAKDEMAEVNRLKNKTEAYKSEAEIAAKIAKEKSELASQAEKEEKAEEAKFEGSDEELKETEKFLVQTKKESATLKKELQKMKDEQIHSHQEEAAMRRKKAEELKKKAEGEEKKAKEEAEAADKELQATESDAAENKTQAVDTKKPKQLVNITKPDENAQSTHTGHSSIAVAQFAQNSASSKIQKVIKTDSETVRRLLEENEKLKNANQNLQKQLAMKKVVHEKDILKAKLKNKLVVIDQHHSRIKKKF